MTDTLTDDLLDPATWQPMPWRDAAACHGLDPALFVTERGEDAATAKAVCATCAVKAECLDYALTSPTILGIWGGTSHRERRAIRKGEPLTKPINHGTNAGYHVHRRRGEIACQPCRDAHRAVEAERERLKVSAGAA